MFLLPITASIKHTLHHKLPKHLSPFSTAAALSSPSPSASSASLPNPPTPTPPGPNQRSLSAVNPTPALSRNPVPSKSSKPNRYRLGDQVGAGFFATVFSAEDLLTFPEESTEPFSIYDRHTLAVKRINKRRVPRSVLTNEIQILEKLSGEEEAEEYLTALRDVFETKEHLSLVFDLQSGGDLFDFVSNHGPLSWKHSRMVVKQILQSLKYLNDRQVLHRDVKLENIVLTLPPNNPTLSGAELINQFGLNLKLTDFGYAIEIPKLSEERTRSHAGTYGYVAPEVLLEKNYSPKSDVWSLGICFYSLLTAQAPFPKDPEILDEIEAEIEGIEYGLENWEEILEQNEEVFGIRDREIVRQGKDLLEKMLKKDVQERISVEEALEHPFFSVN